MLADTLNAAREADKKPATRKRILFVNSYLEGRAAACEQNSYPRNHLWGADALRRAGFDVTILERARGDWLSRFAARVTGWTRGRFGDLAQELEILRNLRTADAIYIANGNVFWVLLMRRLGWLRAHLITWAYTPPRFFPFSKLRNLKDYPFLRCGLSGVLCLTNKAADWYRANVPDAAVREIDWGTDLQLFTGSDNAGTFFLACGRTNRDYPTLLSAAAKVNASFKLLVSPDYLKGLSISLNVTAHAGPEDAATDRGITYESLVTDYYSNAIAVLIPRVDIADDTSGFTNLLEAMAMGRPVVMTKTGCLDLDIEAEGIGLFVEPYDVEGWVNALNRLMADPTGTREMGRRARRLAEKHYNVERFGADTVSYFQKFFEQQEREM